MFESLERRELLAGDFCVAMTVEQVAMFTDIAVQMQSLSDLLDDLQDQFTVLMKEVTSADQFPIPGTDPDPDPGPLPPPPPPANVDELFISHADAGEPAIAQRFNDPVLSQETRTFFEPLADPSLANDVFTGNGGDDVFLFKPAIFAKPEIIAKHTQPDGSVDWSDVAGENDNVHDHWVEGIGADVITDFSEGDLIRIEGHTTYAYDLDKADYDGDGTRDSRIFLKSIQRNGGAHDGDFLGTITVLDFDIERRHVDVERIDHGLATYASDLPDRPLAVPNPVLETELPSANDVEEERGMSLWDYIRRRSRR